MITFLGIVLVFFSTLNQNWSGYCPRCRQTHRPTQVYVENCEVDWQDESSVLCVAKCSNNHVFVVRQKLSYTEETQ